MVTWTAAGAADARRATAREAAARVARGAVRAAPPPPDAGSGAAQANLRAPEIRLYFADYRDVSGLQLPFRLRRAVGADTVEETTFDRFKINAKIDPKKFEVRK